MAEGAPLVFEIRKLICICWPNQRSPIGRAFALRCVSAYVMTIYPPVVNVRKVSSAVAEAKRKVMMVPLTSAAEESN